MVKRSLRTTIFFILVFLFFFLAVKAGHYWASQSNTDSVMINLIIGLIYTLVIVLVFYLAKLSCSKEGFWDVSPYAQCKGGPYFWKGDSEEAKMCRQFAETPEGKCGIASYNCPIGYNGMPMTPFLYTPLSDAKWQNERCEDKPTCPCADTGMCSMVQRTE